MQALPPHPYRALDAAHGPAPLGRAELGAALLRPHLAADLILAEHGRLRAAAADPACAARVVALLGGASAAFALPFALVLDPARGWRVAALFLGSVALCFPSLHVFTSYLGCRMRLAQNLAMALSISAVASLFSLGFAPILWFLRVTSDGPGLTHAASFVLLGVSLLAGLGQLGRAMFSRDRSDPVGDRYRLTVLAWQALLLFVSARLATCLGLL